MKTRTPPVEVNTPVAILLANDPCNLCVQVGVPCIIPNVRGKNVCTLCRQRKRKCSRAKALRSMKAAQALEAELREDEIGEQDGEPDGEGLPGKFYLTLT
jgi:hypothetical protein